MSTNTGNFARQIGVNQQVNTGYFGAVTVEAPNMQDISGGNWTRTSVVTPGYGEYFLSGRRRDLPMNVFTYDNRKYSGSSGFIDYVTTDLPSGLKDRKDRTGYFANHNGAALFSPDSNIFASLDLKARSKLLSGLKNQDVNLAVAAGEGKQTVNLIANKAMQIARAGLAFRKGNLSGALSALGLPPSKVGSRKQKGHQSLAQNWLELQYGVKPLLSDIYGAAQFLAKQNNWLPRSRLQTSASRTSSRVLVSYSNGGTTPELRDVQSDAYTVKYVVYFSEPSGGNPPTALGLTNPLSVAWELVPFSFVADWFLPLGDYFSNVDATLGSTFVKGCVTEFWRGSVKRSELSWGFEQGNYRYEKFSNIYYLGSGIYCKRTPLTGFPSNRFPQFKNPFSGIHLANALALVAQVFRK